MVYYSDVANDEIKTANTLAVDNDAADSFFAGGSITVNQQTFTDVTQSGTGTITHPADADYKRLIQLSEYALNTGLTNTTLDFDLTDAGQFIQEDSVSGTEFVSGTLRLKETTMLSPLDFYGGAIPSEFVLSNSYRTATGSTNSGNVYSAFERGLTSGKWFFEGQASSGSCYICIAIVDSDYTESTAHRLTSNSTRSSFILNIDDGYVDIYIGGVYDQQKTFTIPEGERLVLKFQDNITGEAPYSNGTIWTASEQGFTYSELIPVGYESGIYSNSAEIDDFVTGYNLSSSFTTGEYVGKYHCFTYGGTLNILDVRGYSGPAGDVTIGIVDANRVVTYKTTLTGGANIANQITRFNGLNITVPINGGILIERSSNLINGSNDSSDGVYASGNIPNVGQSAATTNSSYCPAFIALLTIGTYPTVKKYYVTTSDTNQLSLTGVDIINSLNFTASTPVNTTISGLISFDGRSTWKTTISGANLSTFGGSLSTESGWASLTNLSSALSSYDVTNETTLDVALQLGSSDSSVTPSIDLITMNYDENGNYIFMEPGSNYKIECISSTQTKVTKLSSGTDTIKINVII